MLFQVGDATRDFDSRDCVRPAPELFTEVLFKLHIVGGRFSVKRMQEMQRECASCPTATVDFQSVKC